MSSWEVERSIREFAQCSATVDQREGVATALAAARAAAFTLVIDCPVFVHIGLDIARPLFVESGTRVVMRGTGRLSVDNALLPAFVLANVRDVELLDWDVLYTGSQLYPDITGALSIQAAIGYYLLNGTRVADNYSAPVAASFNDLTLRQYYAAHRNVSGADPAWSGPTNLAAMFNLMGDTQDVRISGMRLTASGKRAVDFVLVAFGFNVGWLSDQRLRPGQPFNGSTAAIPTHLTFSDLVLDGVYMGFVGSARHSTFARITSLRYSDLQAPDGDSVTMGGCVAPNSTDCWFPPPHLFYFNFGAPDTTDEALWNVNLTVTDVSDQGLRVGPGHRVLTSGNCCSLKIGAVNSTVQRYFSARKDGAVDVVWARGLTVEALTAVYNSTFLEERWPAWRFTEPYYHDVRLSNVLITDVAAVNAWPPLYGNTSPNNTGMLFTNVMLVTNNLWPGIATNVTGQVKGSMRVYVNAVTGEELSIDEHNVVRQIRPPARRSLNAPTINR